MKVCVKDGKIGIQASMGKRLERFSEILLLMRQMTVD